MSSSARDEEILRLVNDAGSISIRALAEKTYTSPSTIRRDLARLEQAGRLRRHLGGAESVLTLRPPQIIRRGHNQAEKSAAARRAAALVAPGSTIFIDASTTVQYMIPHLAAIDGLTVCTNGVDTVMRLTDARIRAVSTGGELLAESMAYVGPIAADTVRRFYFDAAFFSSAGFDEECISDWSESETVLRRVVLEQAKARYFLADHTKRGKKFPYILCRISGLDAVICE